MKAEFKNAWGYQGDNLNLPVADVDAAVPFYERVMGFRVVSRSESPCRSVLLGRDGVQIRLAENGGDPTQDGCAFEVDNAERTFAELTANGLQKDAPGFEIEQHHDSSWKVFYVVAPDGLCYWLGERQAQDAAAALAAGPRDEAAARSGRLHHELIRGLLETGTVPPDAELRARLDCQAGELERLFTELADQHGVVLHPNSHRVWVVHPFSLAPTSFLVRSGERRWWGCCAWCSLGIAALVDAPCTITSTLGAEEEQVTLTVDGGTVTPADLVVHFPVPMTHAWHNVIYTCSMMLLFRDEAQVRDWSRRHGVEAGDIQPVSTVLELARRWYGEHLRPDWRKKTAAEAAAIFSALGLTHPVWDVGTMSGRF